MDTADTVSSAPGCLGATLEFEVRFGLPRQLEGHCWLFALWALGSLRVRWLQLSFAENFSLAFEFYASFSRFLIHTYIYYAGYFFFRRAALLIEGLWAGGGAGRCLMACRINLS